MVVSCMVCLVLNISGNFPSLVLPINCVLLSSNRVPCLHVGTINVNSAECQSLLDSQLVFSKWRRLLFSFLWKKKRAVTSMNKFIAYLKSSDLLLRKQFLAFLKFIENYCESHTVFQTAWSTTMHVLLIITDAPDEDGPLLANPSAYRPTDSWKSRIRELAM